MKNERLKDYLICFHFLFLEIILRANYVFGYLNPPVKCYSVDEIKLSHFISMYQLLTGEEIPGKIVNKYFLFS
jgi:hypothetical protein